MSLANLTEDEVREALIGVGPHANFDTSYFVEAGAGAGKTWILVRRIVAQLLSRTYTPDQIVAITFTEAATKQLKDELDKRLAEALTTASGEQRDFIQGLRQELGRMQISTVHSFCQTMLQAMPFDTSMGMEMTLVEDDRAAAKAFYLRTVRARQDLFPKLRERGMNPEHFVETFLTLYQMLDVDIAIAVDPGVPSILQAAQAFHTAMRTAVSPIQNHGDLGLLNPQLAQALALPTLDDTQTLNFAFFALSHPNSLPLSYSDPGKTFQNIYKERNHIDPPVGYVASHPLFDLYKDIEKAWKKDDSLRNTAAAYVHAHSVPTLLDLAKEYQAEKQAQHIVSFADLLTKTRDMLQTQPQARAYFQERYRTIYVDEFQDTDPVQTQILFFLTAQHFDPQWDKCQPRPGSLFLVGDPKQSIYRFTGADIQIYNQTQSLFQNGVGEVVVLQYNYRSDKAICDFVDGIFAPSNYKPKYNKNGTLAKTQPPNPTFCGGTYQANYTAMQAFNGANGRTFLWHYTPAGSNSEEYQENDPKHVAAFIHTAVATKMQVGVKVAQDATYGDFMVLLPKNRSVKSYMTALSALGIPCETAGNSTLGDVPPIQRGLAYLKTLSNPTSNVSLAQLLIEHYQVPLTALRRFLHLAQTRHLTQALTDPDILLQVQAQLSDQDVNDAPLLRLCAIAREIAYLRQQSLALSPMALLELLFDGGFGLYTPQDAYQRHNDYALVQQFLMLLKKKRAGNLTELLALAQAACTTAVGRQLPLTHAKDRVQITTVHKSKGLEANVIILAYAFNRSPSIYSRMDRTINPPALHACLTKKVEVFDPNVFTLPTVLGQPPDWVTHKAEEERFLKAEAIRLLYVAATRAKTSLVICQSDRTHWKHLLEPQLTSLGTTSAYAALASGVLPYIAPSASDPAQPMLPPPPPQPMDTFAIECQRQNRVSNLTQPLRYHITPSALEHAPESPKVPKIAPDPDAPRKAPPKPPFGPDWGDIIHRTMELTIQGKAYDVATRTAHVQQAISEILPSEILTKDQSFPLLGKAEQLLDESNRAWLLEKAVAATQFITDPQSGLSQLLAQGTPYPEMNFFISLETGDLYDHLAAHMSDSHIDGKPLDANGSIDLAIYTPKGWIVVDYKTDRIRSSEDQVTYETRLKTEYTNQISAYGKLLEDLKAGPVLGLYLCSIPLGGKLISLSH